MNIRPRLLGEDRRQSAVVAAFFVLLTLSVWAITAVDPLIRLWPPGFLYWVPLIGFVPLAVFSAMAVVSAYSNDGVLVCIAIVYCGALMVPLGAHQLLSVPVFPELVTRLWVYLPISLLWGAVAYLVGMGIRLLWARTQRRNFGLSVN